MRHQRPISPSEDHQAPSASASTRQFGSPTRLTNHNANHPLFLTTQKPFSIVVRDGCVVPGTTSISPANATVTARHAMMDRHSSHLPTSPLEVLGAPPLAVMTRETPPTEESSFSATQEPEWTTTTEKSPVAVHEDPPSPLRPDDGSVAAPDLTFSQQQLIDYRAKLARDLEQRELSSRGLSPTLADKSRVSPIPEETLSSPPTQGSLLTTSTESAATIRGFTPAPIAGTPSYPFPRMAPAGFVPTYLHKPFTTLSPTGTPNFPSFESMGMGAQDKVLSGNSTPASAFTFNPSFMSPQPDNVNFPNPNLYDLSLMLSAEPGLDAWWNTVVQIMKDVYKAERVTLAVPADTTDIENVPWGQKATYNEHKEDDLSLGYMARQGYENTILTSDQGQSEGITSPPVDTLKVSSAARPGLYSRHSFTSYEENKEKSQDRSPAPSRRPSYLKRSQSNLPPSQFAKALPHGYAPLNKTALDEHDANEQHIPSWEAPLIAEKQGEGRMLPVLQALDYEADPLIDHSGVMRVLERGKTIALTRTYPYLADHVSEQPSQPRSTPMENASDSSSKPIHRPRSESFSKLSSIFSVVSASRVPTRSKTHSGERAKVMASRLESRLEEDRPRPPTPKYEEFEQAPPSPWSQSPAPSPAIRADPKDNPFFTDAMVDEDSFNPATGTSDYRGMPPPEAIGVDNSWTVLHIPLTHVLLSKPTHSFKLDSTAFEEKLNSWEKYECPPSTGKDGRHTPESAKKDKAAPIAILSILSPIIPYPSNLRHSLEHLAPHMATSFSLCRHYTNLETELAGMQRKRPQTAGFGAVTADGRALESLSFLPTDDLVPHQSLAGSLTSPSDYSTVSKSATVSPLGTPGWEQGSMNYLTDKRQHPTPSPGGLSQGEGYFSARQRSVPPRPESFGTAVQRPRRGSKENSPPEKRQSRLVNSSSFQNVFDAAITVDKAVRSTEELASSSGKTILQPDSQQASKNTTSPSTEGAARNSADSARPDQGRSRHGHTMLHSYGADFASTFQSLPPSSTLSNRPQPVSQLTRTGSITTGAGDMPPPSDRLKGLILDSLPAHVFVALPQTGEIVWVNSRYLSYRGQTATDLAADPWGSLHNDDRDEYLKAWSHSARTGEQFSRTVRIKRFDGAYRWFYARAVASKDKRGVIMQFLGSYMDIHDQHIAELKAARQEEIEASEAKHRLLANLIPQIIFTATEDEGITFANEQWLLYAGQTFTDSLGLGFMDYVHPDDLARCRIPTTHPHTSLHRKRDSTSVFREPASSEATSTSTIHAQSSHTAHDALPSIHQSLSRNSSSGSSSVYEWPADLTELARKGVIKVANDSAGRVSYTTEVRLLSKAGEYRWHLIRCVEIDTIDFGRGASSYFGSATDINDHKLLEAKLKEAMETKSRFLSNMSHEIRTPLIGISGMVSFLQDTTLNEEQLDYTNTIQTSANSLIMIINDILDLSKVDAGMMKLKYEWFHTRSLIEDVNELVSTMAIAKRLELNYLVEADVPAWVKGDKVRIRQVLLNVIGNAIKFTSEGEVFSRCRVYREEMTGVNENEMMLEFAITDTGRGFSEEEAELMFKPFSQIDGSSTRQHGGSGLGLVISRQLVELHGGTMEGKAIPGKGSTFTFTAKFALPTADDRPNLPNSPQPTSVFTPRPEMTFNVPRNIKPLPPPKHPQIAGASTPNPDTEFVSPVASTGSSNPSLHSTRSQATDRSSATSINTGLARFSEAAKASGQDLSQMKLEMPSGRSSPGSHLAPGAADHALSEDFRPPMYSILIICPQFHSREATTQHIEMTLPKDVPHQLTALATVEEAETLIGGEDPIRFTHIVINLPSAAAIISLMQEITKTQSIDKTTIVVLSDSVQRQSVLKLAADTKDQRLLSESMVTFIYKPVKPSRFAVIFDPNKMRDLSIDRNRSTAQQMVENQKASYLEIERRMGNKGYRVLLVEDNPVNQKVLMKYLKKIGVDVEIAVDGAECTEMVLSKPHQTYSLILCDLHMPRKDGYQACREIRQWEQVARFPKMPIIALSANVMSDVQDKCVAAGFSDYVTKPVDFIDLSRAMSKFF
ncbi:putative histidine kinase HHK2p [Dactylonectria estremocensis]|uniref:histidine kinase n=1 Tax=Dactylonectria estremocensis TaxID=1079267 RepID=A0A9P9JCL2_9HYPO|nr:putative histidine kinase HHK2p [Dactylonectria estremocensis]